MKSRLSVILLLILIAAIVLVACATRDVKPVSAQSDQTQTTGQCYLTKEVVGIDSIFSSSFGEGTYAAIYRPNADCADEIPAQLCIYAFAGYGGGLSCTPLKDK